MSGGNAARTSLPTALIEFRLRLTADKLPEGRKNPNLEINVDKKNGVSISCNTGIFGADNAQIRINGTMGAFEFGLINMYAEQIFSKEAGFKFPLVRLYGPRKKRTPQDAGKGLDCVVLVGKDANGTCFISVMRKDAPQVKFVFAPGRWAELADASTNQPLNITEMSNWYSQAWARTMAPLVEYALNLKVYDFREENDNNGGGNNQQGNGQNNWQQRNNQQGSQQQAAAPAAAANNDFGGFDDDIPL